MYGRLAGVWMADSELEAIVSGLEVRISHTNHCGPPIQITASMVSGGDGFGSSGVSGIGQRVAAGIAYMQEAGQGYRAVEHDGV